MQQLFDSLHSYLVDESLLLRTVGKTHDKSCESVRPEIHKFLGFIERFAPAVLKSKVDTMHSMRLHEFHISCFLTW